ncbi:FkbM family methyltransferase [Longispora albida]|uniref:FkbM family methyltransferase n=1 Tax=Longispora albida TaxID=203523 RepID=UPI00037E3192|nr:FkbM family methyltransferase [Longispora albida]
MSAVSSTVDSTVAGIASWARRRFANTAVERLPFVRAAHQALFRLTCDGTEQQADFRGSRLTVPTSDITMAPGLLRGYYEKWELTAFEQLAAASGLIVDVGANIGVYACAGGLHLPPGGRLVAIEPVPQSISYLRHNLAANGLDGVVQVIEAAAGAHPGRLRLHLASGAIGTHSAASSNVTGHGGLADVPMIRVDDVVFGQPVDVLKVDVEGYDGYVLRGAEEMLHRDQPAMLIEYVPKQLRACGFPLAEFAARVFGACERVYLVDEPRDVFTECDEAGVLALAERDVRYNLVGASRPEHLAILAAVAAEVSPCAS